MFPGILTWLVRYLRQVHDASVWPKSFCSERRSGPIQVTYQLMGVNDLGHCNDGFESRSGRVCPRFGAMPCSGTQAL